MWQRALNYPHFWILLTAWFVTLVQVPLLIRIAHALGAVDRPRDYKHHHGAVPFLGGVAIFLSFALAVGSALRASDLRPFASLWDFLLHGELSRLFGIVVGGGFMLLLGLLDDFRPINALGKLLALVGIALFLQQLGISVRLFPPPGTG